MEQNSIGGEQKPFLPSGKKKKRGSNVSEPTHKNLVYNSIVGYPKRGAIRKWTKKEERSEKKPSPNWPKVRDPQELVLGKIVWKDSKENLGGIGVFGCFFTKMFGWGEKNFQAERELKT